MYPTFVAQFANGETTRMTTYTSPFARGVRLARAAMALRVARHPDLLEGSGEILAAWFETADGVRLADMPVDGDIEQEKPIARRAG